MDQSVVWKVTSFVVCTVFSSVVKAVVGTRLMMVVVYVEVKRSVFVTV